MAGCSSSVKLLCDSGASVNASDFVSIVVQFIHTYAALRLSLTDYCSNEIIITAVNH